VREDRAWVGLAGGKRVVDGVDGVVGGLGGDVSRQAIGRFPGSGKLGVSGSAAPVWTSWGAVPGECLVGADGVVVAPVVLGVTDEVEGVGDLLEEQLLVLQGAEAALA
jgi:hypothetical protein